MPDIAGQRARIEQLIQESEQLEAEMQTWQQRETVPAEEIQAGRRRYLDWYSRAQQVVPPEELARFKDMYEGGTFMKRITGFLNGPLEVNMLYDPASENPFAPSKWRYRFEDEPRQSLAVQREILIHAVHQTADSVKVLEELSAFFRRLPDYFDVLNRASNPNVSTPNITNEKDLQDLVHALLRMLYGDIRPEDYVPQTAGARSRVDFLIKEAGIIVETKMTRDGLGDRKVGEELLIDWGRYTGHPDCRGIFALVYDPARHISNPAALESDLSRQTSGLWTRVAIVR